MAMTIGADATRIPMIRVRRFGLQGHRRPQSRLHDLSGGGSPRPRSSGRLQDGPARALGAVALDLSRTIAQLLIDITSETLPYRSQLGIWR